MKDGRHPSPGLVQCLVVVGVLGTVVAILVPWMLHARDQARRASSRNNLKQYGVALHNFHDTHGHLPAGTEVSADGSVQHGWCTRLWPFLEASVDYSMIDFGRSWDDPVNGYLFRQPRLPCSSPDEDVVATTDGFTLCHYAGNPHLLHRNSAVRFRDMTAGLANTWLLAEAAGEYRAWGGPFNWRPLGTALNAGPGSVGRPTGDGAFVVWASGEVAFIANDVDPQLLATWSANPPVPDPEDVRVPPFQAEYTSTGLEWHWLDLDGCRVRYHDDEAGRAHSSMVRGYDKFDSPNPPADRLRTIVDACPELREFHSVDLIVDYEKAAVLSNLAELRVLHVLEVDVTEKGVKALAQVRSLELIDAQCSPGTREALANALPKCDVRFALRKTW